MTRDAFTTLPFTNQRALVKFLLTLQVMPEVPLQEAGAAAG